jgi:superfamily II DNA or RNA helicase
VIHIELTDKQKKRIKEIPMEYPDPIVQIGKKHQIENGGLTGDEYSDPEYFENGKLDILEDLAIEFPKMVVFAKYKAQIAQIATKLKPNGHKVITLTGETKDRGNAILEANNSKECVFIAQAQISAGWELPSFPVMVFASRTYSFVDLDQSLGRIQRANNIKKNLYIYLVVKEGVDEAVHKCLEMKKDFNEKLYVTSGK